MDPDPFGVSIFGETSSTHDCSHLVHIDFDLHDSASQSSDKSSDGLFVHSQSNFTYKNLRKDFEDFDSLRTHDC